MALFCLLYKVLRRQKPDEVALKQAEAKIQKAIIILERKEFEKLYRREKSVRKLKNIAYMDQIRDQHFDHKEIDNYVHHTVERIKKMELGNYEFYSDLIEGQLEKKRVKLIKDIIEKEVRPILKRGQKLSVIHNEAILDTERRE